MSGLRSGNEAGQGGFEVYTQGNIFCVGRNYREHAAELGNAVEPEPVLFMKPGSAVVQGDSLTLPDAAFSSEVHYETEIVVMIGAPCRRIGKPETLDEAAVRPLIRGVGVGLDLTARDVQSRLKARGLPWLLAKGFDDSCYMSPFVAVQGLADLGLWLRVNGELRQQDTVRHMIYSIPYLIGYISQFFSLKAGDVIFTGTPAGVGPLQRGDVLTLGLEDRGENLISRQVQVR